MDAVRHQRPKGRGSSKTNTLRGRREEGTWAEEPGKHQRKTGPLLYPNGISIETCQRGSKEQAIRLTASGHNPTGVSAHESNH